MTREPQSLSTCRGSPKESKGTHDSRSLLRRETSCQEERTPTLAPGGANPPRLCEGYHSTVGTGRSRKGIGECLAASIRLHGVRPARRTHPARATLHEIHSVFPTPAATGTPNAKDPISENKLAKGDARWDPTKAILGYWLDGVNRTIQLPPSRAKDLLKEVKTSSKNGGCRSNGFAR
jgi:hypothetical protein